jgi:hypothetical protein
MATVVVSSAPTAAVFQITSRAAGLSARKYLVKHQAEHNNTVLWIAYVASHETTT